MPEQIGLLAKKLEQVELPRRASAKKGSRLRGSVQIIKTILLRPPNPLAQWSATELLAPLLA